MAATSEKVRKLPVRKPTAEPVTHKGPDVVINRVEITISMAAPLIFGVPLHFVDWVLERFGLVTKEELAAVVEPAPEAVAAKAPRTATPRAA